MTVLAQKWWVADDAIKGAFQFRRQLDRLLEVVLHKLFEDGEALVILEELDLGSAFVLS